MTITVRNEKSDARFCPLCCNLPFGPTIGSNGENDRFKPDKPHGKPHEVGIVKAREPLGHIRRLSQEAFFTLRGKWIEQAATKNARHHGESTDGHHRATQRRPSGGKIWRASPISRCQDGTKKEPLDEAALFRICVCPRGLSDGDAPVQQSPLTPAQAGSESTARESD